MVYRRDGILTQAFEGADRSQAVRIPVEFRFSTNEVYIRRDQQSGDLILSRAPGDWNVIFDALDAAGVPEDFLADRGQQPPRHGVSYDLHTHAGYLDSMWRAPVPNERPPDGSEGRKRLYSAGGDESVNKSSASEQFLNRFVGLIAGIVESGCVYRLFSIVDEKKLFITHLMGK